MKDDNDYQQKFTQSIKSDIAKIEKSKKNKKRILAQTVFLGTLGLVFVIPVIAGGYLGVWLDNKIKGFSTSWTISLLFVGVVIGALNVYFFIKE